MPANADLSTGTRAGVRKPPRTKPLGVGHPADQRTLWGIGWHRCWSMGPKVLHRHANPKTETGQHAARSSITGQSWPVGGDEPAGIIRCDPALAPALAREPGAGAFRSGGQCQPLRSRGLEAKLAVGWVLSTSPRGIF